MQFQVDDFVIKIESTNLVESQNLHDFKELLKKSSQFEGCNIKYRKLENIENYMKSNKVPNIEKLYLLLMNNKCYRDINDEEYGFIGVGNGLKFCHVGLRPDKLPNLQKLVDWYYNLDVESSLYKIIGIGCYLIYENIHPHYDGNGRMGRLLFLENTFNKCYLPISHNLKRKGQDGLFINRDYNIWFENEILKIYKQQKISDFLTVTINDKILNVINGLTI